MFKGAISIAAPYFDHTHAVAGSIAVYAPEARVTDDWLDRMTERVVAGTAELSAALGHKSSGKVGLQPILRATKTR